jgi:outer membrane assembly lipoprotein YfiO
MGRAGSLLVIAILLSAATAAAAERDAPIWELRDGQWVQVAAPAPPPAAAEPLLEEVERLLEQKQHRQARRELLPWLRANREHPHRDRALMLLARAYFQHGDRVRAFYHLDELMDHFPESPLFFQALELQYEIADAFLRGYRERFLLMPIKSLHEEAIEMLFRIQQRAPGSAVAERALLRTADYYFSRGDFDLAGDAFAAYARSYPHSPRLPAARLRQAFSNMGQFRGLPYDAAPLHDARAQLVDFAADYPALAREENVAMLIEWIDNLLAQKTYQAADFYHRTRKPLAAGYSYRYVIDTYPDSPQAVRARRQLRRLPEWVRRQYDPAFDRVEQ